MQFAGEGLVAAIARAVFRCCVGVHPDATHTRPGDVLQKILSIGFLPRMCVMILDMTQQNGQVVGYVRVSSRDQNPARQVEALGVVDKLFQDQVTGSTRDRPGLTQLLDYVREGDTLRVTSMDRLARDLRDLQHLVDHLVRGGVSVEFLTEGLVYKPGKADALSNLMLHLLGALAEFERALIRERQAEGIAAAKKRGAYQGRRGRGRKLTPQQLHEARQRIAAGVPKAKIARDLGINRSTLYRALMHATRLSVTTETMKSLEKE